jgi:DNA segregation ATPase FtsK/SpoIIIE, S-DNA-T family
MRFLGPTRHPRLNEAGAFVFLLAGLFIFLSLASYYAFDPSWNTASSVLRPVNLTGRVGSYLSDFLLQTLGWAAYTVPVLLFMLGLKWIWSSEIHTPWVRVGGACLWVMSTGAALGMIPGWRPFGGAIPAGGLAGVVLADFLTANMNLVGAVIFTLCCWIVSLYLVSTFEVSRLKGWLAGPAAMLSRISDALAGWRERRALRAKEKAEQRALRRAMKQQQHADEAPEEPAAQPWPPEPVVGEAAKKSIHLRRRQHRRRVNRFPSPTFRFLRWRRSSLLIPLPHGRARSGRSPNW